MARFHAGGAYALVDESMMIQFGLTVGDPVKSGKVVFEIAGRLQKIPGETAAMGNLEPRIYIPMAYLERTRLVQVGSRVEYYAFFKFPHGIDKKDLAASLEAAMRQYHLDLETVESRKQRLGRSLSNLYRFLNLGSFIALLLGSVGVASAVHAYIKQKLGTVAVLRSLGATAAQSLVIYLLQALGMGIVGAGAGVLGGAGILLLLPQVVGGLLPVDTDLGLAVGPVLEGVGVGLGMALLFACLPLLAVRWVSPLLALRSPYQADSGAPQRDPWRWVLYGTIVTALTLFALGHTR
jgi:putative ABC transport system permease protein